MPWVQRPNLSRVHDDPGTGNRGGPAFGIDAGLATSVRAIKPPLMALLLATAAHGSAIGAVPQAHAVPAPEVEYVYNVMLRRHYDFPGNDALGYGYGICDRVSRGEGYGQVMDAVKQDVTPNDEFAANYLVSYAVNVLCPNQIWQLRNSADGYRLPMP